MSSKKVHANETPLISQTPSPKKKHPGPPKVFRPTGPCAGPECKNIVPGGMYCMNAKSSFSSLRCRNRYNASRHVIGTCLECGGPVLGGFSNKGKGRFCSRDHRRLYYRNRMLKLTGPFGPMIEEYLALTNRYVKRGLPVVKSTLTQFFTHCRSPISPE
jgi:hypothetical protein